MVSEAFLSVCSQLKKARIQIFSYLLKDYKPHIKIISTIYEEGLNLADTCDMDDDTAEYKNHSFSLDVYDEQQDLILNIYDSYFLPKSKEYFVIEFEKYDFNLNEFCQRFQIQEKQFEDLMQKQSQYCYEQLNAKSHYSRIQKLMPQFFVSIQSQSDIQVKLMLIDPELQIQSLDSIAKDSNSYFGIYQKYSLQYNCTEMEVEIKDNQTIQKKQKEFSIQLNTISDLISNINPIISNSHLVSVLQQRFSHLIEQHPIEIFEILSQHPHYSSFKVISSSEHSFTFKIEKRESLILTCKKFLTIDEANLAKQNYEKLIQLLSTHAQSNITNIKFMPLQGTCYLLIEKENLMGSFQSLEHFVLNDIHRNTQLLRIVIDLIYEFRNSSEYRLCQFHPSKVFVFDKDNNDYDDDGDDEEEIEEEQEREKEGKKKKEKRSCDVILDDFISRENYSAEYSSIIQILLKENVTTCVLYQEPQDLVKILHLFQEYLEKTFNSSCSIEEVNSLYAQTKKICLQFEKVADLNFGRGDSFKMLLPIQNLEQISLKITVKYKLELQHFMIAYDILKSHKDDIYSISIDQFNQSKSSRFIFNKSNQFDEISTQNINEFFSLSSDQKLQQIKFKLIDALYEIFGYNGASIKTENSTLLINPRDLCQDIFLKFMIQDDQSILLLSEQQEDIKVINDSMQAQQVERLLLHSIVNQKFGKIGIQNQCCIFQELACYLNLLGQQAQSIKVLNLETRIREPQCWSSKHLLHLEKFPQLIELKICHQGMSVAQTRDLVEQLNQQKNIIKVSVKTTNYERRELFKLINVVSLIMDLY